MLKIDRGQAWAVVEEPRGESGFGAPHQHAIRSCLVTIPVRRRLAGRADQKREAEEKVQYEQHVIFVDVDLTWLTRVLAVNAAKTLDKNAVLACGAVRARLDRAPFVAPNGKGCALGVLADNACNGGVDDESDEENSDEKNI